MGSIILRDVGVTAGRPLVQDQRSVAWPRIKCGAGSGPLAFAGVTI
jgi:hypothetical protein